MKFADILKMCFDSLWRRKGRTILTVLGVFIGCTAIIVMVSIGAGTQESYDQMLDGMGDLTIIEVYQGWSSDDSESGKLNDELVETIRAMDNVQAVMPKATISGYSAGVHAGINDRYTAEWMNLVGIDVGALEDMGYELVDGAFPKAGSDEVAVGQYFAYEFTDTLMPDGRNYVSRWVWDENGNLDTENIPEAFFDPLREETKLLLTSYNYDDSGAEPVPVEFSMKVVGVVKEDNGKGYETTSGVMMDISALRSIIKELTGKDDTKFEYSELYVKVTDIDLVADVEDEIINMGYSTYSMQSWRDSLNEQAKQIELMLGGLGAISLLVAAIGITNTMVMSISERTKEIGIMKAMGCYVRDIRMMFLMESGCIGLIGGVLGLIFSFLVSIGINLYTFGALGGGGVTWELIRQALLGGEGVARTSVIEPGLVLFALVFSVLVGLISGFQPANKAVKISALEAIRNE